MLKEDKARLEAERLALENQRVYSTWIRSHPELSCIANERLIFGYLDDVVGISITEGDLDFAVSQLRDRLAVKSPKSVANAQAEELAERDEAIQKENQRKKNMTVAELKAELRSQRPAAPVLPEKYTSEVIKNLPADELSKLMRFYGVAVVNARLGSTPINFKGQYGKAY